MVTVTRMVRLRVMVSCSGRTFGLLNSDGQQLTFKKLTFS